MPAAKPIARPQPPRHRQSSLRTACDCRLRCFRSETKSWPRSGLLVPVRGHPKRDIPMANVNNETFWLMIFVACTGAAVLLQAFVLLAMLFTARKALKIAQDQIESLRTDVFPLIKDTKELLTRVGPKIELVATDVAVLVSKVREQSAKVEVSAGELLDRVYKQTSRVDSMLTRTLDTVDRAGAVVAEVISVPLRQFAGFAAFARAAIGTFRSSPPHPHAEPRPTHSAADKDLFV